jgi:hypothetical protein
MDDTTRKELDALPRMKTAELREKYLSLFGEASRSGNKEFLRRKIAWRIQELAEGGLSERARRRAEELANDADLRTMPPREGLYEGAPASSSRSVTIRQAVRETGRIPMAGTMLCREYKGRDIVVRILPRGFEYEGKVYKSLSAVATAATGTKWNGPAFFGLRDTRRAA